MTKPKPKRSCPECALTGSWHFTDDLEPRAYRCPVYVQAQLVEQAHELTATAHVEALEAAKRIIRDTAERLPIFSANEIRQELEAAQIPGPVVGSAFRALAQCKDPVIARTDDRVQSNEDTTRHEIYRWKSLVYGQRRTA